MSADNADLDFETLRPRLLAEVIFIETGPAHIFIKNPINATYVKLTKAEETIARTFDGTRVLPDILQEQIEKSGTEYFQSTLDAIEKLNKDGLLENGPAPVLASEGNQRDAQSSFNNHVILSVAATLMSIPGLILLMLCGIAGILLPMATRKNNIFRVFTVYPNAEELDRIIAYAGGLIILWLTMVVVISIKNILSAGALTYYKCEVLRPQWRSAYGLIFFDCALDDIVVAGRKAIFRLFAMRIGLPLFLVAVCMAFSHIWTFLEIIRQVCWLIFLFGLSPLVESELTRSLYYITEFGTNKRPINQFLHKKFFRELFNRTGDVRAQKYFLGMSVATLLWLYVVYVFLWNIFLKSFTGLVTDFMTGGLVIKMLTGIYGVIFIIPLVVLLTIFISVVVSNAIAITGSPLRNLMRLGTKIARGNTLMLGELSEFLQEIPLFSKLNDHELSELASRLRITRLRPGSFAIVQGEPGDTFYCVVSGKLHVVKEDDYCREHIVNELGPGDSFGEIALLASGPRTASVVAIKFSTLIMLGRKEFNEFVVRSAGGGEKVTDMIRIGRMIMSGGGILSYLTPCQINRLVAMLKRETHPAGDIIMRRGEPGDRFYIINKGSVFVDNINSGRAGHRLLRGQGEFFGEIALIKNIPRTATITAAEDVELLYLTKNEFYDFLRHNARIGVHFDKVVDQRIIENNFLQN